MSEFYTGLQFTAFDLLKDKGQLVPFKHIDGDIDPVEGVIANKAETQQDLYAVQLPVNTSRMSGFDNKLFEGRSLSKMRFLIVSAKDATFVPNAGDIVTLEGSEWTVEGCTLLKPNGAIDLIYKVLVHFSGRGL